MDKTTQITQYEPLRADIESLRKLNQSLVFNYNDPADNKNARSHIFKLRQKKADIERVRKAAKQDALDYGRRVDAVAAELTHEVSEMIDVHQKPIDEIEAKIAAERRAEQERIEREKAEAERAERERQEAELAAARAESKRIADELAAERRQREIDIARQRAAEEARLKAEAKARADAEAAALREQQQREAILRAERDKLESERAAVESEKRRICEAEEARQRAELAKAEAESRRVREAQEAKERAEFEKAEAVRLAQEEAERKAAQVEADRIAAEKRRREADARRAKDRKVRESIIGEIAASLSLGGVEDSVLAAKLILDGKVSRVTVDLSAPVLEMVEGGAA